MNFDKCIHLCNLNPKRKLISLQRVPVSTLFKGLCPYPLPHPHPPCCPKLCVLCPVISSTLNTAVWPGWAPDQRGPIGAWLVTLTSEAGWAQSIRGSLVGQGHEADLGLDHRDHRPHASRSTEKPGLVRSMECVPGRHRASGLWGRDGKQDLSFLHLQLRFQVSNVWGNLDGTLLCELQQRP